MPRVDNLPPALKPFTFFGVDLAEGEGSQAKGTCPFCGREGKFHVNVENSKWDCKAGSCKRTGNAIDFVRQLYEHFLSGSDAGRMEDLAKDRGYLTGVGILQDWGVVTGLMDDWLVPGYDARGTIHNVYRYFRMRDHKTGKLRGNLWPCPNIGWAEGDNHGVFMNLEEVARLHEVERRATYVAPKVAKGVKVKVKVEQPLKEIETVYIVEGCWDGMALEEVLSQTRDDGTNLLPTQRPGVSLLANAMVVAIPGCGAAGEPFKRWLPLFDGKRVVICFDSDHPKEDRGQVVPPVGYSATRKVAGILLAAEHPPKEVLYLRWGDDGYDSSKPSGYDLRDCLNGK